MTQASGAAAPPTGRGTYFFLSYAHPAPSSEYTPADADPWVRVFFEDLSGEVRRHARPPSGMEIGIFDQQLPMGSDVKAALAGALSDAQVFVPLYSPDYFSRSWPLRERQSFLDRVAASGSPDTDRHVLPVLWIPFPSWDETPEVRRALDLGDGIPAYAENGMRALCMLAPYRDDYTRLLERLAGQIVRLTERSPLDASPAPRLDEVTDAPVPKGADAETPFVVAVMAPAGVDRLSLPVAQYAASTAERLGFSAQVEAYNDGSGLFARAPGVLLIDPWAAGGPGGIQSLRAATKDLPEWVVPVVIADRDDPRYDERGARLAGEVMDMLTAAGLKRAQSVAQVKEFVDIMPNIVTHARRQYLRNARVHPPEGFQSTRLSLRTPESSTPSDPPKAER
ncbi:TIR-like protein FxsC [Micromonospora sp. CPCC 206061]|uniref:TIR-like protein FxsC n=1 Tax=Micromonospora sp. CPCC 206061 TaxID=3122410 RepID=UPI002FF0B65E